MSRKARWMKSGKWSVVVSVLLLIGVSLPLAAKGPPAVAPIVGEPGTPPLRVPDGFFTENAGQVNNEQVRFYSSGGMQAGFAESAVLLKLVERDHSRPLDVFEERTRGPQVQRDDPPSVRGVMARITFPGSNKVMPQGVQEMPHRSNYFIGNDPSKWRTGVRSYQEILYSDLYDGIDLSYRTRDGQLKYEFIVGPRADPSLITVSYEGVEGLRLDRSGELVVRTALGELRDEKPISYQDWNEVACAFVPRAPRSFGFQCEGWDPSRPLVIDPLVYATYLGGGDYDAGNGIAFDASGSAYATGYTISTDFPATPGAFDTTYNGSQDAFVAKLNAAGSALAYATYLGGGSDDYGYGIAVDSSGSAYVTGQTYSADFPATPGSFDTTFNGNRDAFVAKLNAAGSAIAYATYLGGGDYDSGQGIAVDSSGSAYMTGQTYSADFPATPGSFDTTYNGGSDAFVAKLDAAGSALVNATYLGGGDYDSGQGIAVDSSGSAYMTGRTTSPNFPATPGAFDTTLSGFADAFVARLDAAGSALAYATYLGGGGVELGYDIAVDASGSAYVTGTTFSTDFPATPSAYDTTFNGSRDAFVAKLDAAGSALVYATFLGGGSVDEGYGIAVDASGSAYVTGWTESANFPATAGSLDTTYNGGSDAFVAKLDAAGSALVYATYLGGGSVDEGYGIAVDASGSTYVTGRTTSPNFPATPGAFDTTLSGWDAFVAKLDLTSMPILSATGEPNYVTDGLDPETGTAGVTAFVYRVNYTDWDNDTPLAGDPQVHILKGGVEIAGSPFTMTAVDPAETTYADGKWYAFATTLSPCGNDYSHYFTASDSTGTPATNWPSPPPDLPDVPCPNNPPVLAATGEPNYVSDGLDPETGTAGVTSFVYRVNYTDADNDAPLAGDPSVHILNGGVEIAGSPATMTFLSWVGAPNNYSVGALYQYSTTLTLCGSDYSYYFTASDSQGAAAASWPSPAPNLPDLPCAPVLSSTGEPSYLTDGLDPETGTAGVTSFVYRVNYTDADNDTPLAGDPKVHVLKGGVEITASPFAMTAVDPADTTYTDGKLYTFATTLPQCGNDYSYYFTASDSTGNPATDWPSPPPDLPDLPCAPVLSATGEPNFVTDGLDPETGTLVTLYAYRVSYMDADNDPPLAGDPKVHILKGGVEITGSPFAMTAVNPADTTYTDGKLYTYSTPLTPRGTDYTYYFTASDATGLPAMDWPIPPADAPDVLDRAPTADAGPDQPGRFRNGVVTLDGIGSSDPDADALTFAWAQTAGPTVALTGATLATPSFTPTAAGTYTFELTVDDGFGGTGVDNVTVTVVNRSPVADAGPDQPGRFRNQVVTLNGTGSSDPDADALAFAWAQTAGPAVALTGGDTATPSFTPTAAGIYTFELTVSDGFAGGIDTDTVIVTVINRQPVADAGGPYTCVAGETIALNGSSSTDLDGDALTHQWTVHLATPVTLTGQKPTFTCPDTEGTFNVTLTVNDSGGLSGTDDTQLSIQPKGGMAADWTWLIIAAIAVVAVLLILFLLIRRKKRGEEIQETPKTEESQPPR
jgi:hypothetical protein